MGTEGVDDHIGDMSRNNVTCHLVVGCETQQAFSTTGGRDGSARRKNRPLTGGTSGIGYATARAFADEGAKVFITGRTQQRVDAAAASLGSGVVGVGSDVAGTEDLDRLVGVIRDAGAGLDIVFTNAGSGEFATLEDETPEHLVDTLNRNVGGTVFTVQKTLRYSIPVPRSFCPAPPRPPGVPRHSAPTPRLRLLSGPSAVPGPPSWATVASGSTRSYPVPS